MYFIQLLTMIAGVFVGNIIVDLTLKKDDNELLSDAKLLMQSCEIYYKDCKLEVVGKDKKQE